MIEICMENAVCNMKCKYCFGGFIDNHNCHTNKIPEYNESILENKLSKIPYNYSGPIKFWGGEPLANWDILKKVIYFISRRLPHSHRIIISNGSLLTEEKVNYLIKYNIQLTISHDGCGQSLRGKDILDDENIIKCIQKLKMNNLFGGFHMVIHKESDSLDKQINYWYDIYKKLGFEINISWNLFRATDDWTNEYIPDMNNVFNIVKYTFEQDLLSRCKNKFCVKFDFSTDVERIIMPLLFGDNNREEPCGAKESLTIGLSGNEYLCVQDSERKSGTKSISVNNGFEYKLSEKCTICRIKPYCKGICMVMNDSQRFKNCENYIKLTDYIINYFNEDELLKREFYEIQCMRHNIPKNCQSSTVDIKDVKILDIID